MDLAGSALAVIVFEYYAVLAYGNLPEETYFFLVNQLLAVLFLVGLYYSVKTVRGTWVLTGGRFE